MGKQGEKRRCENPIKAKAKNGEVREPSQKTAGNTKTKSGRNAQEGAPEKQTRKRAEQLTEKSTNNKKMT